MTVNDWLVFAGVIVAILIPLGSWVLRIERKAALIVPRDEHSRYLTREEFGELFADHEANISRKADKDITDEKFRQGQIDIASKADRLLVEAEFKSLHREIEHFVEMRKEENAYQRKEFELIGMRLEKLSERVDKALQRPRDIP